MNDKVILIGDKFYKECNIVILPTDRDIPCKNSIIKSNITNKLNIFDPYGIGFLNKDRNQVLQHLYILSDDEIKEHDWFYYKHFGEDIITQAKETTDLVNLNNPDRYFKKIIATTDESLSFTWRDNKNDLHIYHLPQIPQSFIQYFIEQYNSGNIITEVMVEYEIITKRYGSCSIGEGVTMNVKKLKINPDNTINIKPIKDSWSKEELIKLFNKMFATDIIDANVKKVDFDKWIEENL